MDLFARYPSLLSQKEGIEKVIDEIVARYQKGGKVLVCGNGGSSADSGHIVGELMKSFILPRPISESGKRKISEILGESETANCLQEGIPAIDLTAQSAIISAFSNDENATCVYAQLVYGYATENDTVIGISTSGNSQNVVKALGVAKARGAFTVALTGEKPSKCQEIACVTIKAPESETYLIQEYHLPIYHYICAMAEQKIFGNKEGRV